MAFCGKCGHQIPDGDLFCSKCGAKIGASPAAPTAEDQKNGYSVTLTNVPDDKKKEIIMVLRMWARCGVTEAKNLINAVPSTVMSKCQLRQTQSHRVNHALEMYFAAVLSIRRFVPISSNTTSTSASPPTGVISVITPRLKIL